MSIFTLTNYWKTFIDEWERDHKKYNPTENKFEYIKPSFYDFMQWLSKYFDNANEKRN